MNPEQQALWDNIQSFELNDPQADFPFVQRLAMENGWKLPFAFRALLEYKRFIYLCCIAPTPMTPSDEVDQVWHLHLIYTRSYWQDFCRDTLHRESHHGPTKGGKGEGDKFTDWYDKTKELYERLFNVKAPLAFWPDSETRFKEINFVRVNLDKNWIIKKPGRQ
jgi:hypothetical protein